MLCYNLLYSIKLGWIVDITTLCATIIYGLASYAVFKDAKENGTKLERTTGVTGLVLMLAFGLTILLPHLFSFSSMATESYVLFDLWAIIGLVYFRRLVLNDKDRRYGRSLLVWFMLLSLVLFASMMWVSEATQKVTNTVISEVYQHYQATQTPDGMYLMEQSHRIHNVNALFTVASFLVFIIFAFIIISNFKIYQEREKEHLKKLIFAEERAMTDQLTGIKNRHAYLSKEEELNDKISFNQIDAFAIVVCDINNLKMINDQKGHNCGDKCILKCSKLICDVFKHSPVYRIGGDEFAAIIENDDYENRYSLLGTIRNQTVNIDETTYSIIAVGISEYKKGEDTSVLDVFARADREMYNNKKTSKALRR